MEIFLFTYLSANFQNRNTIVCFSCTFTTDNRLRGVPVAFLHKLDRLSVLILNDNKLDSLPSILPSRQLNQLVVYNNPFLPSDLVVKPSDVALTLLSCASTSFLRSNWYVFLYLFFLFQFRKMENYQSMLRYSIIICW